PEPREVAEVPGEGHRADHHSPRLDHDQERPPVEKSDRRMPGLAQVHVLPTSEGPLPGKSGVDERAEQRDDASQKPGADHLRARRGQGSDDGGSDEDAGSDDAAHHHHGGVEEADASRQPFLGHRWNASITALPPQTGRRVAAAIGVSPWMVRAPPPTSKCSAGSPPSHASTATWTRASAVGI